MPCLKRYCSSPVIWVEGLRQLLSKVGWHHFLQVRIEDDVICSTEGPEVISSGVPSDIAAVEKLVGSDAQPLLMPM